MADSDEVDLALVWSRDEAKASEASSEFGIRQVVRDWRDVVNSQQIDAVVVATPPVNHLPATLAALSAGKHVLCQARMAPDGMEDRVTGRRNRRVISLPEGFAELDPNNRWLVETRLQLIEEVACGPQACGVGAPDMEEAEKRIRQAVERRDRKAEEDAIVDCMRAEVRKGWQDFPEPELLTRLYRRAARRRAECGSTDSRHTPSHQEGFRVARPLLTPVPDTRRLDSEWEYAAVLKAQTDQWLSPNGVPSRPALRAYIRLSRSSRVYFDALGRLWEGLDSRGQTIPSSLAKWRRKAASGHLTRPARKPLPPHRPVNSAHVRRDFQIELTISVLQRVGVPPNCSPVSGCRIVSEALGYKHSDERVGSVWKARTSKRPFEPVLRKHSEAMAKRTGLFPYH